VKLLYDQFDSDLESVTANITGSEGPGNVEDWALRFIASKLPIREDDSLRQTRMNKMTGCGTILTRLQSVEAMYDVTSWEPSV
jgi:hypothetical protein